MGNLCKCQCFETKPVYVPSSPLQYQHQPNSLKIIDFDNPGKSEFVDIKL